MHDIHHITTVCSTPAKVTKPCEVNLSSFYLTVSKLTCTAFLCNLFFFLFIWGWHRTVGREVCLQYFNLFSFFKMMQCRFMHLSHLLFPLGCCDEGEMLVFFFFLCI